MADCPLGSDEADCSCSDLDIHECMVNGVGLCIFDEWIKSDKRIIPVCQNEINQFNDNHSVTWKYLGKF